MFLLLYDVNVSLFT